MKTVHTNAGYGRRFLAAALAAWLLLSALAVFVTWQLRDRARLIRDNENERILNTLFASLRDYDDFGAAIEANEMLASRIAGFAVFGPDSVLIQGWGKVPFKFDESLIAGQEPGRFNRYTIPDRSAGSVKFVIHNERERPPPPRQNDGREESRARDEGERQTERRTPRTGLWWNAFAGGNYLYIDIAHPAYWRAVTLTGILCPASIIALLALCLAVYRLVVRNAEYRERIEAQQNLVVLGTAASTLAHEIKNPLHSIKMQTGILRKIVPGGIEEVERIDEEVDRLSALTFRVNDYLRDAKGSPEKLDAAQIVDECSRRLCGFSILKSNISAFILMDAERARSVFENIVANALESGGSREDCEAVVELSGGKATITIRDRGRGIDEKDIPRIFDPFFTTKSSGTGIGLAVCKRFVEAAGGEIAVENREAAGGKSGVEVKVILPAAAG